MKTKLIYSSIALGLQWMAIGTVCAQESIPETVKRHDRELKNLLERITIIDKNLSNMIKENNNKTIKKEVVPTSKSKIIAYFTPPSPKPDTGASECGIIDMTLFIGISKYDFTKIAFLDQIILPTMPYYISGTIKCPVFESIPCSISGTVKITPNYNYTFYILRPKSRSCVIEPRF